MPAKLFFFRPASWQIVFARVEFDINMLAVRFGLSVGWLIARIVSAVKLHIAQFDLSVRLLASRVGAYVKAACLGIFFARSCKCYGFVLK